MTQHFHDLTGVLVLDQVTPVIKALFGGFKLDESRPGNGEVFIARMSETNDPQWDDIRDQLVALAKQLGLSPSDTEAGATSEDWLSALAEHFNGGALLLCNLIEPDDSAELDDLFEIAQLMDDGHGLKAMKLEAAWHSSKPGLFEFGGSGNYRGRHFVTSSTSSASLSTGTAVDAALAERNSTKAAERLLSDIRHLLAGIADPVLHAEVCAKLGHALPKIAHQPV